MQLRRKFQSAGLYLVVFHTKQQQRLLCDLLNQYKLTTEYGNPIECGPDYGNVRSCYFAFNYHFKRGRIGSSKYAEHIQNGCVTVPFEDIFTDESRELYHKLCTRCAQTETCSYCNLGTNFRPLPQ